MACFSSAVLVQTVKVNTLVGNGHSRSDLFPSTRWSVVLAAGRSQAEPEISQAALAELCQTYWAPLYSFVRSRGYTVHDAQDLTQSFSRTCWNTKFTLASTGRKVSSVHFSSPP